MISAISLLLLLCVSSLHGFRRFNIDQSVSELSRANTDFAIDLYKQLVKPNENMIVSGFSVSSALAMLLAGSKGKTANELLTALRYHDITPKTLEEAYQKVLVSLKGNGTYDLTAANSVWVEKSFKIVDTYKQILTEVYHAEARNLNLSTGKEDVNAWVNNKTKGLIPELFKNRFSSDTVMVLVNAIYFKGTWKTKFNNKTFEAGFLNNDVEIPQDDYKSPTTRMMSVKGQFGYTESRELGAYLLDLPYQGEEVSLTIILPSWKLSKVEANLTSENLQRAFNQLKNTDVNVVIPVFKIETEHSLEEPLQSLGVKDIFLSTANLSGINPTANIKVSGVIQKALVDVDVEGTRAAAATGIMIETTSIKLPKKYIDFRATQPFMFVIRHQPTNTILFTGRYSDSAPYVQ